MDNLSYTSKFFFILYYIDYYVAAQRLEIYFEHEKDISYSQAHVGC